MDIDKLEIALQCQCGREFTEQFGRLHTDQPVSCPSCGTAYAVAEQHRAEIISQVEHAARVALEQTRKAIKKGLRLH